MKCAIISSIVRFLTLPLVVLALLLFTPGCTYDPGDEITFRKVERVPAVASFSLDDVAEGDTIILYESTDIEFSVGVDKGEIREVQAHVDGRMMESSVSWEGKGRVRIYVGYGGLSTGTYELSLEVTSRAATNSIADRLGRETTTTTRTWPLKVDIEQPPAPKLRFSAANGFLKISWDPYLKSNFASYKVTYGTEIYNWNYSKTRTVEITDANQSYWIDSSYVTGFPLEFEVVTNTVFSSNVGRDTYHHLPQLTMQYESADSTATLSWSKSKFPSALKSYLVMENGTPRAELSNINDTTFSLKLDPVCGQRTTLSVNYVPWYNGYREWMLAEDVAEPVPLETFSTPWPLTYNVTLNKLFAFDHYSLKLLSYNDDFTLAGESQLSGTRPAIPSQGNYGYHIEGNSVVRFDLTTGEKTAHEELAEIPNTYIRSASGTGLVSMAGTIKWQQGGSSTAFTQIKEFGADEFIYFRSQTIYESSPPPSAILSDDGQYAYLSGALHHVSSSGLTKIGNVSVIVDFRADDNEELITMSGLGDVVRIYNSADLSLKRTIPPPEAGFTFQFYDPVTNTLLFKGPYTSVKYIVDLETGEARAIKSAPVQKYINGSIFFDDVHYKKLL